MRSKDAHKQLARTSLIPSAAGARARERKGGVGVSSPRKFRKHRLSWTAFRAFGRQVVTKQGR